MTAVAIGSEMFDSVTPKAQHQFGVQTQTVSRTERYVRVPESVLCIVEYKRAGRAILRVIGGMEPTQIAALQHVEAIEAHHRERIATIVAGKVFKGSKP